MNSKIDITLAVGECNGYMNSQWFVDNVMVADIKPTTDNDIDISFNVTLPCTITAIFSGKNMSTDTVSDESGNIVRDKFIFFKHLSLARVPVPEMTFRNFCNYETENQKSNSTFYGFPGKMTLELDEKDPILWHFKHNHYKVG
jgi:hypothetical protein